MICRFTTVLLCVGLCASSVAYSAKDNHGHHAGHTGHPEHAHGQHAAHVHGAARLLVAVEDAALAIELYSPAMNIIGFEHKPKNAAQQQAIQDAVTVLNKPADLFTLAAAAGCKAEVAEVDAPHIDDVNRSDGHERTETHTEFSVHYYFSCQNMALLREIGVNLMQKFPGIEEIEVQLIAPSGQRQLELTAAKQKINL